MNKGLHKFFNKVETALGRERMFTGPIHAQIEPTSRCNQDCVMCSRLEMLKTVGEGDMSLEQFKRLLDQMPNLLDIQMSGLGEPLMNPLTPQFIKLASDRGIKVSMNCNGAFITEERAELLLDSGLNVLKISMDGADPELYEKIRRAKLEPVLKGLDRIVEARRKRPNHPMTILFNSVIQRDNKDHLLPIVHLARDRGVEQIRFKVVGMFDLFDPSDLGVAQEDIPVIARTLKEAMMTDNISVDTNIQSLIDNPERLFRHHEKHPCYSPFYEVYVQAYGGIRLCCEFYDPESDVGNIYENTMDEIWNGERMREIRRRYWDGDLFFPNCDGCNRFYFNEDKLTKIKESRKPIEFLLSKKLPETKP